MSNSDKILSDVIACLQRQHNETNERFVGKPCIFGVGLPSAIASMRHEIIGEISDVINNGLKENGNE